ncbi:MAG: pyrroloquinoline quinone precursor peptide PqqA [Gammaproteobacteria bacterium]|nr:pyrroloquinoline quinone precursor peptide PqqA [Gammaproteobacteria bacterium]MBV9726024.1 pyrroloquinoline quinone precursor peptide PqqA [Gammaproteobacteria bacterium]
MIICFRTPACPGKDTRRHFDPPRPQPGRQTMRWETPQAIDFRFGMEITMYIANR